MQVGAESGLPDFVKEEFDPFPDCGILAHGFMRLRCVDCTHEKPGCLFLQKAGILPFVRWAVHGADDCSPDRSRYPQCTRAAMGAFIADSAVSSIRDSSDYYYLVISVLRQFDESPVQSPLTCDEQPSLCIPELLVHTVEF